MANTATDIVSVAEAKSYIRIDDDVNEDDVLIQSYIETAVTIAQQRTQKILLEGMIGGVPISSSYPNGIPQALKTAILDYVALLYENRGKLGFNGQFNKFFRDLEPFNRTAFGLR